MTDAVRIRENRRSFLKKTLIALPAILFGGKRLLATPGESPAYEKRLDFLDAEMDVVHRNVWTASAPKPWLLKNAAEFHRLTVHHSGSAVNFDTAMDTVVADLHGILHAHTARNYGDIGYHFIIDYAGVAWEGRSLTYEGAHVSGENHGNIGVVLLGNFEEQEPSAEQLSSLRQLVTILRRHYGIEKNMVYGHLDLSASACPGKNLYPSVREMRNQEAEQEKHDIGRANSRGA